MEIKFDQKAGAMYIRLQKGKVHKTIEKDSRFLIDVDKNGKVLGLELLQYSKTTSLLDRSFVLIGGKKFALPTS